MDNETLKEALIIMKKFKKMKPYRGSLDSRQQKFLWLNEQLSRCFGIEKPKLIFQIDENKHSGHSCYIPLLHTIILKGRLSVITYLHEFGHALGLNQDDANKFAYFLFSKTFPILWSKLKFKNGLMVKE